MRKHLIVIPAALAVFLLTLAAASIAYAHPYYAQSCSDCHYSSAAVKIAVVQIANDGTTATYDISVTGGSGNTGWAVLDGTVSRSHASNASSSFSVPVGRTYRVWAVKTGSGANSISLTPSSTPMAPVVLSIGTSTSSVYLPKPFVLSGILHGGAIGDTVVVMVVRPGSPRWSYSSARLVYKADGSWWYRYTPKLRGVYQFKATFAGNATVAVATTNIARVTSR